MSDHLQLTSTLEHGEGVDNSFSLTERETQKHSMAAKPNRQQSRLSPNEQMIIEIVRRNCGVKRSAITGFTNLTQPSVHRIVDGLLEQNFLTLGETVIEGRGKPSKGLELNPAAAYSVGLSVNTDSASLCICNFRCDVVHYEVLPVHPGQRASTLIVLKERTLAAMRVLGIPRSSLVGLGCAMSGYFVPPHGYFVTPEPLQDWSLVNIESELESLFETPVWTENNATTGAVGESVVGAGLQYPTFGYLSFNYGFGAGVIIDGKPIFGSYGNAGEISRVYTLDEVAHRPALGELIKRLRANGVDVSNMEDLRQRFDPAWPGVDRWVEEVTPFLNRAIDAMWAVFDPAAIVFGGELPRELGEMLIAAPSSKRFWRTGISAVEPVKILSRVSGDPAAIGAALIPLKDLFFS